MEKLYGALLQDNNRSPLANAMLAKMEKLKKEREEE